VAITPRKKRKPKRERKVYPPGTVVWRQGIFWRIIPPPYDLKKPLVSTVPPDGVRVTKGTPQETLTFIDGKLPFGNVSFDLGVVDGFIDVKRRTINYTGGGLETLVGKRLPEPTRGLTLEDFKGVKITKEQARTMAEKKIKEPDLPETPKGREPKRRKAKGHLPTKEEYRKHIDKVIVGL